MGTIRNKIYGSRSNITNSSCSLLYKLCALYDIYNGMNGYVRIAFKCYACIPFCYSFCFICVCVCVRVFCLSPIIIGYLSLNIYEIIELGSKPIYCCCPYFHNFVCFVSRMMKSKNRLMACDTQKGEYCINTNWFFFFK